MARWGEGDPRWIVEERADARNVNNWHWTEKDASKWSSDKINELFGKLKFENDDYSCSIINVAKCEGEARVNSRKGKLIFFYEWQLELDWCGERKTGPNKTTFNGKAEVLNLSEEYDASEIDITVTCTSSSADAEAMKNFLTTIGLEKLRLKAAEYIKLLKEVYSQDVLLPTKDAPNSQSAVKVTLPDPSSQGYGSANCQVSGRPKDLTIKELSITEEFFCVPEDLFKVLTTKELVQAFTHSDAVVDAKPDGAYSLFGGNISGIFDHLDPGKAITMRWRKREWPENHYSLVKMELAACTDGTRLSLSQEGVPAYDLDNTFNGWKSIVFGSIKQSFGYGGRMFV